MSSNHNKQESQNDEDDMKSDDWKDQVDPSVESSDAALPPYYKLPDKHDPDWLNKARKASITHTQIKVLRDEDEQIHIRRWVVVPSSKLNLSAEELSHSQEEVENTGFAKNDKKPASMPITSTQNSTLIFNTDESSDSNDVFMDSDEDQNLWSSPVSSEEQELKTEMTMVEQYLLEAQSSLEKMISYVDNFPLEDKRLLQAEIISCKQRISRSQALFFTSKSKIHNEDS